MDFKGKSIAVTGASRGIGAKIAQQLVDRGARVIGIARDPVQKRGVIPLVCDLSDPDAPTGLARQIAFDHPDCAGLINNAAQMVHTDLTRGNHADEIETEIALNLTAPLQLSVAMLPLLSRNGPAFICNVTSGLAIAPRAEAATYCATKAGLRSFTQSLRYQCADAGLDIAISEAVMTLVETTLSRPMPNRYPAAKAAKDVLDGIAAGRPEIWVEKTKLLRVVMRFAPAFAHRIMRGPNVVQANAA